MSEQPTQDSASLRVRVFNAKRELLPPTTKILYRIIDGTNRDHYGRFLSASEALFTGLPVFDNQFDNYRVIVSARGYQDAVFPVKVEAGQEIGIDLFLVTKYRSGIFVSYSHCDRDWLQRLQIHLAPYVRGENLELWDDTKITPGSDWAAEIDGAIAKVRVAVLLVSPEFLASEYVAQMELPAILRRAGTDLTVLWIPVRASAFEVTPLKNYQAAHDPSHPLATLSRPKQDEALVAISKKIAAAVNVNVVANALKIIDDFEPQMKAFVAGAPEPDKPIAHSWRAEQVEGSIKLVEPGGSRQLITAEDLENLDPNAQKLVRAYERTMKELFERWTELKPKRYAQDEETRREAREESNEVRNELCLELKALLGFVESMGMSLQDHYAHVRYICSQQSA
jgi:TIR domain